MLLLWKFLHGNRNLLVALLRSEQLPAVLLSLCHFILIWVDDIARPSMVHLCMLCLLLLSSEKEFHQTVNAPCTDTLPHRGRTPNACAGTFADLLVAWYVACRLAQS